MDPDVPPHHVVPDNDGQVDENMMSLTQHKTALPGHITLLRYEGNIGINADLLINDRANSANSDCFKRVGHDRTGIYTFRGRLRTCNPHFGTGAV